jgi:two-component system, LytTR family, sensor kinase
VAAKPEFQPIAVSPIRPNPTGWAIYIACGLLYGVYLGINQIIGLAGQTALPHWKPLVWELSSVPVVFALIPLIVLFERRFHLNARPRGRTFLLHLGAALVFSAVHITGMLLLRQLAYAIAGERYEYGDLALRFVYELQKDLVTYLIVLLVIFAGREFRIRRSGELRAAELAAELSQARLSQLTAQIEPHFLFNALNAISNRMHEDVEAADRMISDLGNLMRAAYDSSNQALVPLARELEWLQGYASMMTERFRGQLSFVLNVPPQLGAIQVPRLLLQPLVENALRHGLSSGKGALSVDVVPREGRLHYTIRDDGAGIKDGTVTFGTGLSNVARRLELLYPGTHSFEIRGLEPRGTEVLLSFPMDSAVSA